MSAIVTRLNGYSLFAEKFGNGPEVLIAFHGFGQHAGIYHVFDEILTEKYTVYSFEHFHHGRSFYPPNKRKSAPFSPALFRSLIETFLNENGIEKFTLMGYSLGGKTALFTYECFSEKVNKLILLAPDGIIESGWYKFVSRNPIGEALYKSFIRRPDIMFGIMKGMTKVKLVSQNEYKFATGQLSSDEKRKLIYYTWRSYSLLKPHISKIKTAINELKTPVFVITGKYDHVLNARIGEAFVNGLHAGCHHIELIASHDLIRHKTIDALREIL
ncbi:MAG: alpha/beta hydrolase [Flavobacteriales bacterium]|nr:alpha/beta hydrolase [Flavobacteriales bacterium]